MNRIIVTLFTVLLIQSLVVTKTFGDEGEVKDCFEKLNRATFALNMGLDKVIFKPISKGYRKLPSPIRTGTGNALNNLSNLITIPNNILQGDFGSQYRLICYLNFYDSSNMTNQHARQQICQGPY